MLRRYAVGALSRCLAGSRQGYSRVHGAGGLAALVGALDGSADGQTQCYAAGALGWHGPACTCSVLL